MPGGSDDSAGSTQDGCAGGWSDVNGTVTASTARATAVPPRTSIRSTRSGGAAVWSAPPPQHRDRGHEQECRDRDGAPGPDAAQHAQGDQHRVEAAYRSGAEQGHERHHQQHRQHDPRERDGVGPAPLREEARTILDPDQLHVELGSDRRAGSRHRAERRDRQAADELTSRQVAVESHAEQGEDAEADPDRPHPVHHGPHPGERDQPPAQAPVVPRAQPGAEGEHDQQVAQDLRPHRETQVRRAQGGHHQERHLEATAPTAGHEVQRRGQRQDLEA